MHITLAFCFNLIFVSSSCQTSATNSKNTKKLTDLLIEAVDSISHKTTYVPYWEGGEAQYTCKYETYSKISIATWEHTKDDVVLSKITVDATGSLTTLRLNLTRFDHNTAINCNVYENERVVRQSKSIVFLLDINSTRNAIKYDDTMVTPHINNSQYIYNAGKSETFTCSGKTNKQWLRIKGDDVQVAQNQKLINNTNLLLSLVFVEEDDGAKYFCVGYTKSIVNNIMVYTRHVSTMTHFIMNTTQQQHEDPGLDKSVSIPLMVMGGAAVVAGLVALAWKAFSVPPPTTPAPHEVDTYACANAVQYVELQNMPSGKSGKQIIKNDTPYAMIIGVLEPSNT